MHHYFAGHGYAALRIDVRGSGDSEGVLVDEYTEAELEDGVAVIAWIAAQPWCTGAVGMMGKSWGGFNALQIAARRPPALKAVISVCASDDRYTDDAHYMGGCLLNENLTWGAVLQVFSALPPDPATVGERWRAIWLERLERAVLFPEVWLRHQRRDQYWKRGSVAEDLGRIACPVYAVGGWADAYTNAIPRLLAGLTVPRMAMVGPWGHVYPHIGVPGPAIGFLQEALRWWDQWLKGIETGVMSEPLYRVWMGDRWVAERSWPSERLVPKRWVLDRGGRLREEQVPEDAVESRAPQSVGLAAPEWCAFDEDEVAGDQRDDDARSLTFDTEPLAERIDILGAPVAVLEIAVDRPQAFLAVRLNEVAPDGSSVRVTYGLLDLTHRAGHEHPEPLEPGHRYAVRVALNHVAHAFAPGNRIRLAISTAYWPVVWPASAPVVLTVYTGASRLELPVRPPDADDDRMACFAEPQGAPPASYRELRPMRVERTVERDGGEVVYTVTSEAGAFRAGGPGRMEEVDLEIEESSVRRYRIRDDDPLSARAEVVQRMALRRGAWAVRVESRASFWATPDSFELRAGLEAFEGDSVIESRSWERSVPRDGV
jgi:putative CocE/NonD family hydrolase